MLKQNKIIIKYTIFSSLLLFFPDLFAQTGSNKYSYMYYYELKDSSKSNIEVIHISNDLSRKIKYYYLVTKELGLRARYVMELENKYEWMKFKLKNPYKFESDSLNRNSITDCFEDILNPFEMEIFKPIKEFNNLFNSDTIFTNSVLLKTNKCFNSFNNYTNLGLMSHDNPSPKQINIKGYFCNKEFVVINGYFFFENINDILKDSLIKETIKLKGKNGFKKKLELYQKLLEIRGIEYLCNKTKKYTEITFIQYSSFKIIIDEDSIDRKIQCLISGGNILETLAPLI